MTLFHVTPVAEAWLRDLQELVVIGAVGFMTVRAIFAHRRMLPEKRSAFLRVAAIAVLIDRVGLDELLRSRPMGIVAVRASHLPLS